MRFIILAALCALILPGCMTSRLEDGVWSVGISPPASLERVQKSEAAAKEYGDTLADGVVANAEAIGNTMTAISAAEAKALRQAEQNAFDLEDIYTSELFYTLMGAAGLGEYVRRKRKTWKAEVPSDIEVVETEA